MASYDPTINNYTSGATETATTFKMADNSTEPLRNFTVEEVMKVHFYYGLLIDRAVTPFWYIIGLVGNTISAMVWLKPRMRKNSSSAIYLSALSINDNLCLLLHLPQELHYAWYLGILDVPVVCQMYGVLFMAVQYLSPFLVLSFTFDRFIAICYPFKKYRFCTTSTAVKMVVLNVVVGLAFSSVQGYLWTYNVESKQCVVRAELLDETHGTSLWLKWTTISESLIFLFIPSLNTFLNILVIHEIWKISGRSSKPSFFSQALHGTQQQQSPLSRLSLALSSANCRRKTSSQQSTATTTTMTTIATTNIQNGHNHRQHQHLLLRPSGNSSNRIAGGSTAGVRSQGNGSGSYNSSAVCAPPSGSAAATNVMLLSVSFYVIFTTLPPAIIYSVESSFPYGELTNTSHQLIGKDPTWQSLITYMYVRTIVYELSLSHFACNFFLFAFTGRKFRAALSSTFRCRLWRNDLDEASSYHGYVGGGGGGVGGLGGVEGGAGDGGGGVEWFLGPQDHCSSQQQQSSTISSKWKSSKCNKDLMSNTNSGA